MSDSLFERPILNSRYEYPGRHWHLDPDGQPTNEVVPSRRGSELLTPVARPQRQRRRAQAQGELGLGAGNGISTAKQEYNPTRISRVPHGAPPPEKPKSDA